MSTPLAVERRQLHGASAHIYRVETRNGEIRTFKIPEREVRTVATSLEVVETRDDGQEIPDGEFHIRGHASVFGRKSDDLGGFREIINPGAFKRTLDQNPDVRALFNHDPNYVLGRTKSNTLDLREDPRGLHYYVRAADTSYARDLKVLMARGDVDQSSFAFSMDGGRERWEEDDAGNITRTIIEVSGLFDVSPVTYPAYPQADASVARDAPLDASDTAFDAPAEERTELPADQAEATVQVDSHTDTDEELPAGMASEDVPAEDTPIADQAPSRDELLAGARQRISTARRLHIYPKK